MTDQPNPERLHHAVDALLHRPTLRIDLDGGGHYTVTAPSPLEQLADAIGLGSEGGGRGVPGSRLPINADLLDLWVQIAADTAAWAAVLGVDRRNYRDPAPPERTAGERPPAWMTALGPWLAPVAWDEPLPNNWVKPAEKPSADPDAPGHQDGPPEPAAAESKPKTRPSRERPLPAVGRLLRAAAATAAGRPDRQALAERITTNARRWTHRIEQLLTPPEHAARGLRGVPCQHCHATWVTDPNDPEQLRQPAVWVEYGDTGIIRCLWCRTCGNHIWRDDLIAQAKGRMAA